jgi:hypothetical protein
MAALGGADNDYVIPHSARFARGAPGGIAACYFIVE